MADTTFVQLRVYVNGKLMYAEPYRNVNAEMVAIAAQEAVMRFTAV
jgi:hypothetical protein